MSKERASASARAGEVPQGDRTTTHSGGHRLFHRQHVDVFANPTDLAAFDLEDEAVLVAIVLAGKRLAGVGQLDDHRVARRMHLADRRVEPRRKGLADTADEL